MENLNQLFADLGTQESILILSWLIIAFLVGLLAGYFLRNRYVNELNKQLEEKEQQLFLKQNEWDQAQNELALKEADLKRAAFEAEEARLTVRQAQEENQRLIHLATSAQAELDKTKAAEQSALSVINDLNDQILGLKTRNVQLLEASGDLGEGTSEVGIGGSLALDRLSAIEVQLARLTEENTALLRKLGEPGITETPEDRQVTTNTPQNIEETSVVETAGEFFVPKVIPPTEPEQETTNMGSDSSNLMNSDKVLLRNVDKNDLTAIDGIGPFLEKKLNDVGVFTYADIAGWDAAKIEEITQQISFFEGRIEKDDWVGQAQKLIDDQPEEFSAESTLADARDLMHLETAIVPAKDNLKLILGIDEPVEKILLTSGIDTFAELARLDPDEIRNILEVIDPALSVKDPSSWPAQARLALDEEWEVLQDYQEQLKGA